MKSGIWNSSGRALLGYFVGRPGRILRGPYYQNHDNTEQIKEDECRGDNGGDNRKDLAAVINNSQYAKHQGSRERAHYQQPSKGCEWTASPRVNKCKTNKRCDRYDDKNGCYFTKSHFEPFQIAGA